MSNTSHNLRVALVWNGTVFHEKMFSKRPSTITVGDRESNEFIVPAENLPEAFSMFERSGSGYTIRFTDKLEGTVELGDESYSLDELVDSKASRSGSESTAGGGKADVYEFEAGLGDWGLIDLGDVDIYFHVTEREKFIAAGSMIGGFDPNLATTLTVSAIVHIGFLIFAMLQWEYQQNLEELEIPDRFVKFMAEDVEKPPEEEEMEEPEEDTTGKKAGGEEGKFGEEDAEVLESKIPKVDGKMRDEIDVENVGVHKVLNEAEGPLKDLFKSEDGNLSAKMDVAMSGEGGELQVGRGAGGMGLRGTGKGGGGEGYGRIGGLGKVDTGGGKGTGAKLGKKKERKVEPRVTPGTPEIGDFCDRGNIRRVVGAKSRAVKYCYNKELQTNPDLAGKIVLQWRIGLDGKVMQTSVASSTMGNKSVEGCIQRVVKRMRFDKPKGGICVIQYPFVFSGQ